MSKCTSEYKLNKPFDSFTITMNIIKIMTKYTTKFVFSLGFIYV